MEAAWCGALSPQSSAAAWAFSPRAQAAINSTMQSAMRRVRPNPGDLSPTRMLKSVICLLLSISGGLAERHSAEPCISVAASYGLLQETPCERLLEADVLC